MLRCLKDLGQLNPWHPPDEYLSALCDQLLVFAAATWVGHEARKLKIDDRGILPFQGVPHLSLFKHAFDDKAQQFVEPDLGVLVLDVLDLLDHDILEESGKPLCIAVAQIRGELLKLSHTSEEIKHPLYVQRIALVKPITHLDQVYQFSYWWLVISLFCYRSLVVPHLILLLRMIWEHGLFRGFIPGPLFALGSLHPHCGP